MEIRSAIDGDLAAEDVAAALERLFRLFRRLGTPSELSLTAVSTLSALERTGPGRLTALAAREGVTQPAMTQLVSRLQESGLVTRASDPEDGRVVRVHITDAGREALARRRAARADRLGDLLDRLGPDERAALTAALPAIDALTRLEPEDRTGAARPAL
ncbi:MarR family winged helix-turn-helix transcriptional regulator [Streptomyces sp. NPDC048639]|uniref:MarR family winged helix-turn-helix transcriptional regulator n=1 Tax=Streptomyces sp. NPDC048639 TaxID=3365581 RepID=UPI003719A054